MLLSIGNEFSFAELITMNEICGASNSEGFCYSIKKFETSLISSTRKLIKNFKNEDSRTSHRLMKGRTFRDTILPIFSGIKELNNKLAMN